MKYQVLEPLIVKTAQGEQEIKTGQIITLPTDKALKLVTEGKISPAERLTVKIYSEILGAHLFVVETNQDMQTLRAQDVTEPIYTGEEIRKLKGSTPEHLKAIHKVKEVFEKSIIEEKTN